ncbi:hypothetical protein [Carboxylicivirga marina]|uniref:Uncharacterized protein n=1 Tax=Carboxylicivirga marina TaxID=2800988 RepID=A0ABS1HKS1_9BACT|nr:hypothetical protein [Carboxylicivirga marina]MBK3518195.1 hypothetical protein [Carboxylicivirga marina]
MEKRLNNRLNMYKVVRDYLNTNMQLLEHLPGLKDSTDAFAACLVIIAELDKDKSTATVGSVNTKAFTREQLEDKTLEASKILKAFATFTDKPDLLNGCDVSSSQLSRFAEQALLTKSAVIVDYAETHQVDAEPYGMTTERLAGLKDAFAEFDDKQTLVRSAIVNRKNAGEQLEARMEEADELLKGKLDVLMELASFTLPELHNQYKGARVIVDR